MTINLNKTVGQTACRTSPVTTGAYRPKQISKTPQIELWSTINRWSFYQISECEAPLNRRKAPQLQTLWRRFWCRLCECRHTQSTLTASWVWWIVSIVTCESAERGCGCSCVIFTWSKLAVVLQIRAICRVAISRSITTFFISTVTHFFFKAHISPWSYSLLP